MKAPLLKVRAHQNSRNERWRVTRRVPYGDVALVEVVGVSLHEAALVCATTPARELGLQGLGMIAPGALADLAVTFNWPGLDVRNQEGEAVFDTVERVRQKAVRFRREEDDQGRRELEARIVDEDRRR